MRTLITTHLLASLAGAQTVGSSLQGTITDPSGAVVPNGRIEIRNTSTVSALGKSDPVGLV